MWADFVIHAYVSHEVYVICNIMVSNWLKTVIFNLEKNPKLTTSNHNLHLNWHCKNSLQDVLQN